MIGKKDTATESKVDVDVKGSIFGKMTTLMQIRMVRWNFMWALESTSDSEIGWEW